LKSATQRIAQLLGVGDLRGRALVVLEEDVGGGFAGGDGAELFQVAELGLQLCRQGDALGGVAASSCLSLSRSVS
jgi:hypothetical protein